MPGRVQAKELPELLSMLTSASEDYRKFLSKHGFPEPSLDTVAPDVQLTSTNASFFSTRTTLIESAQQIIRLVRGPRDTLLTLSFEHCASATLQVALNYKFANHIPLEGTTSYTAIADSVGKAAVTPALVERIIQHASSFGLFQAFPGGLVGHNAMSALLVTDPDLEAWMELSTSVAYPSGAALTKALEQYGYSMEADEAGYGAFLGRKVSQFARFREADGAPYVEMFGRAMRGVSVGGAYDTRHDVDGGYPWHLLEQGAGHLIVDVGGGVGHLSIALAQKYPSLRFEVQDLPETVAMGEEGCPEDLKSRIRWRSHDFLEPQPEHKLKEGESIAYFCRFILHDWSDKYAQKILQQLATGLRPEDRIIIDEVVVPEPGQESRERERRLQ